MNEGQSINLIYAIGGLVLVGSSLLARRLPLRQTLKMALAWVAIFAGLFVLFALRDDFGAIWQKVRLAATGDSGQAAGGAIRITAAEDGHYYVRARVNGRELRFMVDSGASVTSISAESARAAGVEAGAGYPVIVDTANGMAEARRAEAGTFEIGPIRRDGLHVFVMDSLGDTNLLGMNFLSSLKSWRFEGTTLILES